LTALPAARTVEETDACFIMKDHAGLSFAWQRAKAEQWCFLHSATTLLGPDHPASLSTVLNLP
jgi:hypothetical protein